MTINRRTGSHGLRAGKRLIPRLPAPSPSQVKARSILGFYKLGKYVAHRYKQERRLRRDPDGGKDNESYCPGLAIKVAKRCRIARSTVDLARMFAERYSLQQARRFDRLRLSSGKRLSRRHVITLLFVSPKQAKTLTAKVRREGWSACRLELEVKRLRPKRRLGGRPPRQPESRTEAVVQLIDSSERWLHRYETYVTNSKLKDPLRGYGTLAKRLRRVERELTRAVTLAQNRLHH